MRESFAKSFQFLTNFDYDLVGKLLSYAALINFYSGLGANLFIVCQFIAFDKFN